MVTHQRHGCALERNELQQLQDSPSAAGRSSPGSPRNASTSPSTCLVKTNPRQQRQKVDLTNAIYPRNRSSLAGFTAEREITKPIDPGEAISGLAPCGAAWMLHTNKKRDVQDQLHSIPRLFAVSRGTVEAGTSQNSAKLGEGV